MQYDPIDTSGPVLSGPVRSGLLVFKKYIYCLHYLHLSLSLYIYIYTYRYLYTYIYMYVRVYIYIYIYIYIYTHVYVYTHTYIYIARHAAPCRAAALTWACTKAPSPCGRRTCYHGLSHVAIIVCHILRTFSHEVDNGESRHFCHDPVCPDPVWKPSKTGTHTG